MDDRQVVAFRLDDEEYAVEIQTVKEIIRPPAITRIPKAVDYIIGVINLRGIIVPVISLSRRFGLSDREFTEHTRILILNVNDTQVGITVDSVTEVFALNEEQIEKSEVLDTIESKYIQEVGKYDNRLVLLLNLPAVLAIN